MTQQNIDPSELTRLLTDTVAAMTARQEPADADHGGGDVEGVGAAGDGLVVARVGAPGVVTALSFDPRAMRLDSTTLAEYAMAAVNNALADLRDKSAGPPAFGALAERLTEIQQDAQRRFASYTDALADAQERLAAQGGH